MPEFDTIIKDGMVFDGARNPRYRADIGISDGVIAKIGRLRASDASKVIDASNLHVAPGFIDLHTHYDSQLFWDPYCSISGWHGVTSVVIGNCGFGFAPVAEDQRDRAMLAMSRNEAVPLDAMRQGMPWDWVTFPQFLDSVERTPKAVNILPYVGLNPLLIWVMGMERAKAGEMPTDKEHAEMRRLLHEAMDAGACGWSVQRLRPEINNPQRDYDGTPMATDVMHDETCIELAEVLAERNDGFIQLTLGISFDPMVGFLHTEKLAEVSGRPVIWNAVAAKQGYRHQLAWLQSCIERGLRVYGQTITTDAGLTFTLEDWNIWDDSDTWRDATLGTVEERLAKLSDPARRQGLKDFMPAPGATGPFEDVTLLRGHTEESKKYENLRVEDIARMTGKHPVDALLDLAVADGLRTVFYTEAFKGPRDWQREINEFEFGIPGVSDGGAHTKFVTLGRWSTEYLMKAVRDSSWISAEHAHWALSGYPAFCAGFKDRGVIREGAPADIVVYDFENLDMEPVEIAHDYPGGEWRRIQRAKGYRHILVNGEVTIEDDKEVGVGSGQLLRHGVAAPSPALA